MSIDKQKLQALLWSEVAAWKADCAEWKRNTEALQEFLGEKTVEEVALELLAENERLSASPERQIIRAAVTEAVKGVAEAAAADAKAGTLKEIEQLKVENESLRKAALDAREFILHEAEVRGLLDENNEVSFRHPRRLAAIASIDAAMSKAVQP